MDNQDEWAKVGKQLEVGIDGDIAHLTLYKLAEQIMFACANSLYAKGYGKGIIERVLGGAMVLIAEVRD